MVNTLTQILITKLSMTIQKYFFIKGFTGVFEGDSTWLAGNNYFTKEEEAIIYLNKLEDLARKVNSLEYSYSCEDTEEFKELKKYDHRAMVDCTEVFYSLESSIFNII